MTVELCVKVVPLTVKEVKAVVAPTAPDSVTVLLPVKVKLRAPSIVVEKESADPVSTTLPVNETAPVMPIAAPLVVKLPPKLIAPV